MRELPNDVSDQEAENVHHDPKTNKPWACQKITDVRSFWASALKKLGIRCRRPYNMRHTYATIGLMSGAKPAFLAKQLGHSLRMFFTVYAKWITSEDDDREMEKTRGCNRRKSPEISQPDSSSAIGVDSGIKKPLKSEA